MAAAALLVGAVVVPEYADGVAEAKRKLPHTHLFNEETAQRAVRRRQEIAAEADAIVDQFRRAGGNLGKALRPHVPEAMGQLIGQMKNRDPKVSQPALRMYIDLIKATSEDEPVGVIYITAFKRREEFSLEEAEPCILCGAVPE